MNDKKIKQLNILVIIALIAGLIFIGLFVFVFAPDDKNKITSNELIEFNESWILRGYRNETDSLIRLPVDIEANAEETIQILHRVPDDLNSDTVLVFETEFQNIMVSVGDKKVYTNGVLNNQKLMKNAVPSINVISLEDAKPGDIVTINMVSAYDKYSGRIGNMYYGSRGDVISTIVKENGVSFVFAVTLLIVAVMLGISLIFMKNVNVDKKKAAYAFGFIFVATLWCVLLNPIMQLITHNVFGVYMSSMILLLIMPILYVMYQRCFAVKRRFAKIFEIGIYIYAVNFLTGIVFQMVDVCDFATYMIFTKILITIGLILISGIMYLATDTFSDKTIYNNFYANIVLTIACILEAIFSLFRFYKSCDGLILQIGIYIFMIMLVIIVEKGIIREMNQTKDEALTSLEYERNETIKKINYNFVINSLNVVLNDLKLTDKENSKLIYDTSVYLKYNIRAASHDNMVPFSEELEYINSYLGMQVRRNELLEVSVEDKVVDFMVPFNTIEPLVENAVVNGALRAPLGGRIVIRSYERLDCYAIQIVDNGKGIGPDKKFEGKQTFKAIRKRLKSMCGAGVEIKNKPDKGTIVTVKVPKEGFIIKE